MSRARVSPWSTALRMGSLSACPRWRPRLVRLQVDIILADGVQAVQAVQHASGTIPIIFPAVPDPVGEGLVASLARPGGNTTGVIFNEPELMGKRLELLKEAVPGVTRVAYLWNATPAHIRALHETERAACTLGIQLHPVEVREPYLGFEALSGSCHAGHDGNRTKPLLRQLLSCLFHPLSLLPCARSFVGP